MDLGIYLAVVLGIAAGITYLVRSMRRQDGKSFTPTYAAVTFLIGVLAGGVVGAFYFVLVRLLF